VEAELRNEENATETQKHKTSIINSCFCVLVANKTSAQRIRI